MKPADEAVARFAANLDALAAPDAKVGVAVSGGADSLALLLLAAAARPGLIEAATVDHGLRVEAADEAQMVADVCAKLNVPHVTLNAQWAEPPRSNVQAAARAERYRLLSGWASERRIGFIATAHHADDQVETLLMRLARGAGVAGLAGIHPSRPLADGVKLIRPLADWRRGELAAMVSEAGLVAADDPSNRDLRYDRVQVRRWLESADWLDPRRVAASADALREANEAIEWALAPLVAERIAFDDDYATVDPAGLPREMQRRLLVRAFTSLGAEPPRGPDLARAMAALAGGRTVTLAGLKLEGGPCWRLSREGPRRS